MSTGCRFPEDRERRRSRRRAGAPVRAVAPGEVRGHGPRVERHGLGGLKFVGGTRYEYELSDDGPPCDIWFYEGLMYPHKRHVAAVGFERDDMGLLPITYDEMRPGCYEPKARLDDMELNWVEASLCFPTFPRFCGQTFLEAHDRDLALACVYAYNDWMVEEWCGDSAGRLVPLCIIPLWDVELAARSTAQRRARCPRGLLQRDRAQPRSAEHPLGLLGSVLRRVRADRDRRVHAHRVVVEDAGDVARRAAGGAGHAQLRQRDVVVDRLPLLRCPRAAPEPEARVLGRVRSAGFPTSSSGPTTCGSSTARGAACATSFPNHHRPTTTGRSTAASSATGTASTRSTRSASTTRPSRPTTRTPTRRGRTRRRSRST